MRESLEIPIEAFVMGGMTEAEATAYTYRELENLARQTAADELGTSASNVDTLHQRAKKKAALPPISKIDADWGKCITIWFQNDAQLRYRWDDDEEGIVEETFQANDPHSVFDSVGVGGEQEELEEYALAAVERYINEYQNDAKACLNDWTPVYQAITLHATG